MTKQDYMRLSKERLAELLAERDAQQPIQPVKWHPYQTTCGIDGGMCINPFHHCDGCPRMQMYIYKTSTTTSSNDNN